MARTYIAPRPTVYKGIQMRSRLEAEYAAKLDARGATWQYEPKCFADETGQYLPDFLNLFERIDGEVLNFYIELEPFVDDDQLATFQRRMEIIWSSEPDARLLLVNWEGPIPMWVGDPEDHRWFAMPPIDSGDD